MQTKRYTHKERQYDCCHWQSSLCQSGEMLREWMSRISDLLLIYFKYIYKNIDQLPRHPEEYTPYAVAKKLKAQEATNAAQSQSNQEPPRDPLALSPA